MTLSRTAYVILGMLELGPRTGYEIKSLVDISTRFFWAASYGQIYPELKHLEELRLVRGEDDPDSGRRRRAYELTPAGRDALHAWLVSEEPPAFELRHEGVLKFFFADALDPKEQMELVARIRMAHEQVRDELRAIEPVPEAKSEETGKRFPLLTLQWGIAYSEFLVEWCARTESELAGDSAGVVS